MDEPKKHKPSVRPWMRPWLRAIHRDMGYVAVGLTLVYAISGLAVNHVADFTDGDASFVKYTHVHELGALPQEPAAAIAEVRKSLAIKQTPRDTFVRSETELEVSFDKRTLQINTKTGHVVDEGEKPRFFLRLANWIHLNRGKKAWSYIADAYAVALLFLAISGLLMIPGRKGLFGRGLIFAAFGVMIPVLYVTLAGGPQ